MESSNRNDRIAQMTLTQVHRFIRIAEEQLPQDIAERDVEMVKLTEDMAWKLRLRTDLPPAVKTKLNSIERRCCRAVLNELLPLV